MDEQRMSTKLTYVTQQFYSQPTAIHTLPRAMVSGLPLHWNNHVLLWFPAKFKYSFSLAESFLVIDQPITSSLLFPVSIQSFTTRGDWGTDYKNRMNWT